MRRRQSGDRRCQWIPEGGELTGCPTETIRRSPCGQFATAGWLTRVVRRTTRMIHLSNWRASYPARATTIVRAPRSERRQPSAPRAPLPSESDLARDLESELLNELQASFSMLRRAARAPRPQQPIAAPPVAAPPPIACCAAGAATSAAGSDAPRPIARAPERPERPQRTDAADEPGRIVGACRAPRSSIAVATAAKAERRPQAAVVGAHHAIRPRFVGRPGQASTARRRRPRRRAAAEPPARPIQSPSRNEVVAAGCRATRAPGGSPAAQRPGSAQSCAAAPAATRAAAGAIPGRAA